MDAAEQCHEEDGVSEEREQKKSRVYVGNIPENTKETDLMKFFGSYVSGLNDIELTRQRMAEKEVRMPLSQLTRMI